MKFDDVNYEMYNKFIFSLNPTFNGFQGEVKSLIGTESGEQIGEKKAIPLTKRQLT